MRKIMTGFAFAAALALCGGSAHAVDQFISGKKLLIKNKIGDTTKNKIVYISKDTTIALPAGATEDPRCAPDGSGEARLTVSSVTTGESASIDLGGVSRCGNWSINGAGNRYKYKDTSGASCKIVLIKGGKLQKAVCKGSQVSYALGADQVSVDINLTVGTAPRRYCSATNDTTEGCQVKKNGSDSKTYLAKKCTSGPAVCGASPSGAFLEVASLF